MAKLNVLLSNMREICLALPDTKETLTWGTPHFRVNDKIFAGYGEKNGQATIGFKLEMDHADAVIEDPRFSRAPYVGHKGWVSMVISEGTNWAEVRDLILESYKLIAAKRSLTKLALPALDTAVTRSAASSQVKKKTAPTHLGRHATAAGANAKKSAPSRTKKKKAVLSRGRKPSLRAR